MHFRRVIAIAKVRHRPYATNSAASALASKMSSDENAISAQEDSLASRTAGAVKEFGVRTMTTSFHLVFLFYTFF